MGWLENLPLTKNSAWRVGPNFSITSVVVSGEPGQFIWTVGILTDDLRCGDVRLGYRDLVSRVRFRAQCLKQLGFLPDFFPGAWQRHPDLTCPFTQGLLERAQPSKAPAQTADELLLQTVRELLVFTPSRFWHGPPATLLRELNLLAGTKAPRPLAWPTSTKQLAVALKRIELRLWNEAQITWRRGREPGSRSKSRARFYELALYVAPPPVPRPDGSL